MFTGLIQQVGQLAGRATASSLAATAGTSLTIAYTPWETPLVLGESIAIQGVCLTVTSISDQTFTADILDETLARTTFQQLQKGSLLNMERALAFGERLGGHFVTGHIDETGILEEIRARGRDSEWRIRCSPALSRQTVLKGSIAIDGVSLTISSLDNEQLGVNLIPHTLQSTTLRCRSCGDTLNLEGDILGKYVARLLKQDTSSSAITETLLRDNGFFGYEQ